MLKSSGAMAAATLTSRVLGMVREIVYARFMGVGWVTDAFVLAFQIPSLFRRLLGEGALTAAFIPIFKEKEKTHGEEEMWRAANAVLSGLVIAASVVIALVMITITFALDAHHFSEKTELMLRLLRVMFPYMLLVCVAAVMMGMLNARGHFFIPAMGATMLNVVMIASVLWLAPKFGTDLPPPQRLPVEIFTLAGGFVPKTISVLVNPRLPVEIFALAYGVLAAGMAQAAFQMPTLWRDGFRYRWVSPWRNETVRRVVVKMIPGTIGIAAFQINVTVVQVLSFWVGTGIVSSFGYAVRLMELPQGLFGISLATYLLPTLSGLAAEKKYTEYRATLRHGLSTLIFLNMIASALLVVLAVPIVRLLFERGSFDALATRESSYALMCLAPGLVAFSTVNILARAFYALGDTQTPMKISIACLVLNLALAVVLVIPLQQGGLGIANTLTSICNVGLLTFALRKKLGKLEMESLGWTTSLLGGMGILAGIVAFMGWKFWEEKLGHATLALKIGAVFVPAIAAGALYWLAALAFKIPAATEIFEFVLARSKRNK